MNGKAWKQLSFLLEVVFSSLWSTPRVPVCLALPGDLRASGMLSAPWLCSAREERKVSDGLAADASGSRPQTSTSA